MCGIFGYVGDKEAGAVLLEGLRTLEYRGYDSAGVFVPGQEAVKAVGPITELTKAITAPLKGTSGIAHTRWATHGAPTYLNAHPHGDPATGIWLVHNGIIENYQTLKADLEAAGVTFVTDTDTEVLARLIGSLYEGDLQAAVTKALALVRGTYGIAVMLEDDPDTILAARLGSPIVLGVTPDGHLVSSDPSALLAYTKEVIYLEDGETAMLQKDSCTITTRDGTLIPATTETIDWDLAAVQKEGFDHFMLKEIFEAPQVITDTIRGRINSATGAVTLGGVQDVLDELTACNRLQIVGCGSAYYAGVVGKYLLETYADMPVDIELASEYRYKKNLSDTKTALLAVTQSGETADTLASVRKAKAEGLLSLGIVNAVGSSIARETDASVYNHAGPEIAVASTKAFISQVTVFVLLTLLLGERRGLDQKEQRAIAAGLTELPQVLQSILDQAELIEVLAKKYAQYRDAMFIGRTHHAPIAYEGALKLKEVAYVHAEAYAGGELKHGPIAMLDESFPVIALVPQDAVYEKMVSNIAEVRARKAPVLAIATDGDTQIDAQADDVLYMPTAHPALQPIVSTVPLHLLAYYIGVEKGLNVDRPRNLAKSVTVE